MPRTITLLAAFYWMAFFAVLAVAATNRGEVGDIVGMLDPFGHGGQQSSQGASHGAAMALLTIGFTLVSTLFLWAFVTALFEGAAGDGAAVTRHAVGAGAAIIALLLLADLPDPTPGILPALSVHVAALMATYAAVSAEGRAAAVAEAQTQAVDEVRASARMMARGAADTILLGRLAGRARTTEREADSA